MPHFPAHDWYRLMIQSMRQPADALTLELVVIPANKGILAEVTRLRQQIARAACAGLATGETILNGEGEATLLFTEEIRHTALQDPERLAELSVITNSQDLLFKLENAPGLKTILTSGEYQTADRCLVGPSLGAIFERVCADLAYLVPGGLSPKFGWSSMSERFALAGSRLVDAARRTIVLANHTISSGLPCFPGISATSENGTLLSQLLDHFSGCMPVLPLLSNLWFRRINVYIRP
jgi:hypothetical protein